MNKPAQIAGVRPASDADVRRLAQAATYVGSPKHKAGCWWGGLGSMRVGAARRPKKQHTTICPLNSVRDKGRATKWLRRAISRRQFAFVEGDKRFPKHDWYVDAESQGWAGRCVNSVNGEYKSWPVDEKELSRMKNRERG